MGTWGPKLYQDDIAMDVRDEFKDRLHRGKEAREITDQMIEEYYPAPEDPEDGPVFWFALADTQWSLGRLLPDVKENALAYLDSGTDLQRWEAENPKLAKQRRKVLDDLREKLESPQPPMKKISQYRLYKCEWNIGDVFAYQLESDLAKERGLYGRYFLLQKVDETIWHPGHIIPIVYVKITGDETLPTTTEEYDQLEYVQISFTRYERRLYPIDIRDPDELERKLNITYELDEFGFLPEFRAAIITTSSKVIPKKLIFIGNFPDSKPPEKEYIPHDKLNIVNLDWNKSYRTLESDLIKCFFWYSLRESSIYQPSYKDEHPTDPDYDDRIRAWIKRMREELSRSEQ